MAIHRYLHHRDSLIRRVQGSFPSVCPGLVEDAVSDAFCDLIARPDRVQATEQRRGSVGVLNLLRVIAWRHVRAGLRRSYARRESLVDSYDAIPMALEAPEAEVILMMRLVLRLVDPASRRFGHVRTPALKRALIDRLMHGATDAEAAEAHRVPREYVNRARLWIAEELAA